MEVIENKNKYVRRESRRRKILRILRKFFWVFPVLAIGGGLLFAWQLIRNIQAESGGIPGVKYEEYFDPAELPEKEKGKLQQYREQMKKEKEQKITSRYERIISGREIIGRADYGEIIPQDGPGPEGSGQDSLPKQEDPLKPKGTTEVNPSAEITGKKQEKASKPETGRKKTAEKEKATEPLPSADSLFQADSMQKPPEAPDPFFTLKTSGSGTARYTKAHFYGDQDILSGSYIRLRLGEDMLVDGKRIPRNTVFRGLASLVQNKIEIRIDQIGSQLVEGRVCDQDFNPGIVIPAAKQNGTEEAVTRTLYETGSGSAMDLPYEILQDVSRNIIRNKRRKQSLIRMNDGYLVYITQTTQ